MNDKTRPTQAQLDWTNERNKFCKSLESKVLAGEATLADLQRAIDRIRQDNRIIILMMNGQ